MCGENRIAVGGAYGRDLIEKIEKPVLLFPTSTLGNGDQALSPLLTSRPRPQYSYFIFPDADAANCLTVNNTLVRRADSEFPRSAAVWHEVQQKSAPGVRQVQVVASELAKVDGALTCCSLLLEHDAE